MSFDYEDADFIRVFVCFDFEWRRILGQSCMGKWPKDNILKRSGRDNSGSYPKFNNLSKTKSPDYSARKKITAEKKYANARFIVSDLVPVGTVTNLFEDKLGTRGPDEIITVSAKETLFT